MSNANIPSATAVENQAAAPIAKKIPHVIDLHGDTLVDNYHWMRKSTETGYDVDLMPHLIAENAHHDAYMSDTVALQDTLFAEMRARIKEADQSVPAKRGRYSYYSRTEEGKQYSKHCRRLNRPGSAEEIFLDVDQLAEGHKFFEIAAMAISPSGNFLAYTYDTKGFRQYTLVVKNLRTGEILPDTAERVTSIAWAADNKTIFYTTEDEVSKRADSLFVHKLRQKKHQLVYQEPDELFRLAVSKTRLGEMIYLSSESHTTSETSYIRADSPRDSFKLILPRQDEIRYSVDEDGRGNFYMVTNDGAKNFRLVKTPVADPNPHNWQEIVPHRENVLLDGCDLFANHLVVYEKDSGLDKVSIHDLANGGVHQVSFPEPAYVVSASANHEYGASDLRLSYASMVKPSSVLSYDMNTLAMTVLKTQEVPTYNPDLYESERIFATASDGTQIPMSIVYRKGMIKNGNNPLLLYAYGSYGYGMPTGFSANRVSLLDRSYIFVIAHIRGGNEMGEEWHEQGKMMQKMNTFTDYISCAEHLIAEKYTNSSLISGQGGSAGGLLMGAVANLRGTLFNSLIAEVPFVDVINTMLDETLPLTVGEFIEWGNPKIKEEYLYMRQYSPYENVEAKDYPALLVRSALYDSQVMYWEPAKFVARLRELKTDNNPLLFHILLEAGGHGGLSGRFDYLKEIAAVQAYLLKRAGIAN
ncbi:MAG: S9 family peptidase [Candidatus Obscuribacterales bacterium]|nr:S9 family peptidase [Candidatus Obscuribacterales bacterium]